LKKFEKKYFLFLLSAYKNARDLIFFECLVVELFENFEF